MNLKDFSYPLPEELIARFPAPKRGDSRLFTLDVKTGERRHRRFRDFPLCIGKKDLLVFNDTRVIPARVFGRKLTGGRVEILLERVLKNNRVLAQLRVSKSPKRGSLLLVGVDGDDEPLQVEVLGREDDFFLLQFPEDRDLMALLEQIGHMPLPPYIDREDQDLDAERYQTVYARQSGAVAAPTAGLHFDQEILEQLDTLGVEKCFLTLHVGAGTFQPVRVEKIETHRMHKEVIDVNEQVCERVRACKQRGGRVIAVGTTTVRSLETAAFDGELKPYRGETEIFIYPGFKFKVVDAMVTNFHLPESTLLMLVSAFCGDVKMLLDAYEEAIRENYRFFSYGDAMFLCRAQSG